MSKQRKRKKPTPDFPLFPHASGQWAKKIRGKLWYFGMDAKAALEKYRQEKDDLQAGIDPRTRTKGITLRDLVNLFLSSKRAKMDAGELSPRTWQDYFRASETLVDFFGKDRTVASLQPGDFDRYRAKLSQTKKAVAMRNAILRTRILFNWCFDNEHIEKPVRFGSSFDMPSAKTLRKAKREGGAKTFAADELRKLIDAAKQPLKAMILLGVNCGFGQGDIAALPLSAIDLKGGWINFPRPKTETDRRCPLWQETLDALREAIDMRPEAIDAADSCLAFLTIHGRRWIRSGKKADSDSLYFNDYIAVEFDKLLRKLGLKRRGSFYNLRHVHRTIADSAKDKAAADAIMGHVDPSMGANYVERIEDDRLKGVVSAVREWLFPKPKKAGKRPAVLPFKANA